MAKFDAAARKAAVAAQYPLQANKKAGTSPAFAVSCSLWSGRVEAASFGGHVAQQLRWREAAAEFLGKLVALGDEGLQADGVDLADRAATEGREAPAHDRADIGVAQVDDDLFLRSEEHTSELQSLMRISYAVFCLNIKT